jgi:1,4-dihydroxy-2-naphthoyl-CoA synthase
MAWQSTAFDTLRLDWPQPHVARVTLNRPDVLNAINTQMGDRHCWTCGPDWTASDAGDCAAWC